jgi:hypothetical protein
LQASARLVFVRHQRHWPNGYDYLVALLRHHELVAASPADWMPWNYAAALAQLQPATATG